MANQSASQRGGTHEQHVKAGKAGAEALHHKQAAESKSHKSAAMPARKKDSHTESK